MSSEQPVVIDRDGERGTIIARDEANGQVHIEHDGRVYIVGDDLLHALGESYYAMPLGFGALARQETADAEETLVIPLVAEALAVTRETVDRGAVRVHVTVNEREVVVDEPMLEDEVIVSRVAMNRPLDKPLKARVEGDTTIIPVMKEVLMVRKQLVLVEEIRLTRKTVEARHPQVVVLRAEEARVERVGSDDNAAPVEGQMQ